MNRIAPRVILGVLLESGQPITRIRLMKLLFIIQQETNIRKVGAFYNFIPYKYGPYSFYADHDLLGLMRKGLVIGKRLRISEGQHKTALDVYHALPKLVRDEVKQLILRYQSRSDYQLVNDVYARYPNYTVLSKRQGLHPYRVFASPAVYTIGYEGFSVDAFLNSIIHYGIVRILDVRANPLSRRYGFSKKTLSDLCKKIEIEYMHIPELGVPSEDRQNLSDLKSYQKLLDHYEKTILPLQANTVERVSSLVREKASSFICYEADVHCCHRSRIASQVAAITKLPIHHLEVLYG